MVKLKNSVVLITGADGGLGQSLVKECVKLGAKKIYATGLNAERLSLLEEKYQVVHSMVLDVTNLEVIKSLHKTTSDTNILINNAGIEKRTGFLDDLSIPSAEIEMKVNYIGVLNMCNTYVPAMLEQESGAIVNVLSIGGLLIVPHLATYCASKAAAHFLTEGLRHSLKETSILVSGVYAGYIKTEMTEGMEVEKSSPDYVAKEIMNSVEDGQTHIYPDPMSQRYSSKLHDKVMIIDLK
jgi:short-subunit dehydrogenase